MAFGGNTRDLGSFGEETDEITDLHQILEEVLLKERGDGVASIKRHRRDLSGDGVRDLVMALGRLIPNPVPAAPYVPPTNKDLEILFQPMFDEYFEPPSVKRPVPPAPAVQVLVVSAGTPSSITFHQDAPSTNHSPSSSEVQPPILHQGVVVGPTFKDNPFAQADNNPFVNPFAPESSLKESSSGDVSTAEPNQVI
ncbi:hypothetical protein Tco_0252519 [Tanacetum coccineum]